VASRYYRRTVEFTRPAVVQFSYLIPSCVFFNTLYKPSGYRADYTRPEWQQPGAASTSNSQLRLKIVLRSALSLPDTSSSDRHGAFTFGLRLFLPRGVAACLIVPATSSLPFFLKSTFTMPVIRELSFDPPRSAASCNTAQESESTSKRYYPLPSPFRRSIAERYYPPNAVSQETGSASVPSEFQYGRYSNPFGFLLSRSLFRRDVSSSEWLRLLPSSLQSVPEERAQMGRGSDREYKRSGIICEG